MITYDIILLFIAVILTCIAYIVLMFRLDNLLDRVLTTAAFFMLFAVVVSKVHIVHIVH